MNAKKIARRARALERFSILNFPDARDLKSTFEKDFTEEDYKLYLERKRIEYKALGGK